MAEDSTATHRALLDRERAQLSRDELGIDKFIEVTIVIFALLVGSVVLTAYVPRLSILLGVASFLTASCLFVILYLLYIHNKYKQDLKDHIYEARGAMKKTKRLSHDHLIEVGPHTFTVSRANPAIWDFFQTHEDGAEISVLYSPRTKIVWSITKI
jgi:hypothetical protein